LDSRRPWTRGGAAQTTTLGVTDLMTSLAIIFVLLLVVFVNASRSNEAPLPAATAASGIDPVRAALEQASPHGLPLEWDPSSPEVLRVIIPDSLLNFEFGKSTLAPAGERFLADFMPRYAATLCGFLREQIAGVVIEGHTDDLGGDAFNLKLSQERSFHVLVSGLEAIEAGAPSAHACFARLASASGRGKQDLVVDAAGRPDPQRSRRVVLKLFLRSALARAGAPATAQP
jgi:outer membrane protein OmpA-like peptidoglycan-associated protein